MTGAQFDSAAQAQLQQHDKFKSYDAQGREVVSASDGGAASSASSYPALLQESKQAPALPSPSNARPASSQLPRVSVSGGAAAAAVPTPDASAIHAGLSASLHLLDKYGADADASSEQKTATPSDAEQTAINASEGQEEPKTQDRRL